MNTIDGVLLPKRLEGAKWLCEIPRDAGKCVGIALTPHGVIIACEFAVFLYVVADDTLTKIIVREKPQLSFFR